MPTDGIDSITEIAQQAVEGVTNSQNNWAAIILLIALMGILAIVAFVLRASMKERSERFSAREEQTRADTLRREQEIRQGYQDQLQQTQITRDFIGRMNDRYDATLNKVTEAFGDNSAVIRQAKDEIRRNADVVRENTAVIEANTETLQRLVGARLPKIPTPRKAVDNE
jgi:FtsZ-interacting cell division protein ZipA